MEGIENYKQLAAAITLQAVKEYVYGTASRRKTILSDLRSMWMDFITDGFSLIVAEQLEKRPDEICENLRLHHEIV